MKVWMGMVVPMGRNKRRRRGYLHIYWALEDFFWSAKKKGLSLSLVGEADLALRALILGTKNVALVNEAPDGKSGRQRIVYSEVK